MRFKSLNYHWLVRFVGLHDPHVGIRRDRERVLKELVVLHAVVEGARESRMEIIQVRILAFYEDGRRE